MTDPGRTPVSPDMATCDDCLAEILDPDARRSGYAFTNCTNCGPRFTITLGVPYDRPNTTMAPFEMCAACRTEYDDPTDRRFHAQPIACPDCGPHISHLSDGTEGDQALASVVSGLLQGDIVAIKGLGGYHIACDATNKDAVTELRWRKRREEKPLAVMVGDIEMASSLVEMTDAEIIVLTGRRRPIVLLAKQSPCPVAESVAPNNRHLGVMLPYTPLHHLLLRHTGRPLVMTSGNLSDEPIAYKDKDADRRLRGIADSFLVHNRPIHIRCDDSVVRVVGEAEYPIRRSRGYAPEPIALAERFERPVLATGAELKNTFCIGVESRAILSHHIGDLENYEALGSFSSGIDHFKTIFDVLPQVIAHDLHPEYLSTKWALEQDGIAKVGVQHHHAHIVSCLADNERTDRVIGLALDGTGYGTDGTIWGFEVMDCDAFEVTRGYHLEHIPLPGGASAMKHPWRVAAVWLDRAFGPSASDLRLDFVTRNWDKASPVLDMATRGINSPLASSAGRLFDAVASLCGLKDEVAYEGQAAAMLEQVADASVERTYPFGLRAGTIDATEVIRGVAEDLAAGTAVEVVAGAFHASLCDLLVRAASRLRDQRGLTTVALSGGTWQNLLLLERSRVALMDEGFEVLVHHRVPANDGGISLGQAVIANRM